MHSDLQWDQEFDLIVLGAGGAGMTAALVGAQEGLHTVVLERSGLVGGTTALSSGTLWVPGFDSESGTNLQASEDARLYLNALVAEKAAPEMRNAFLVNAPKMMRYLAAHTQVRFRTYAATPDYHQHLPGASKGGQAHEPLPFDASTRPEDFRKIRWPLHELMLFGGMMVTRGEALRLLKAPWSPDAIWLGMRLCGRYVMDRLRFRRGSRLVLGNALVARLLASLADRGVEVRRLQMPKRLLRDAQGIVGVLVDDRGRELRLRARHGVVLAGGGFPANQEWCQRYLPSPVPQFSPAAETCRGETLQLALEAGGMLREPRAGNGLWFPSSINHRDDGSVAIYPHIVLDRSKPGLIAVNREGRRFTNEAVSYHAFGEALFRAHQNSPSIPAALIVDSRFLRLYGLGIVRPKALSVRSLVKSGYLKVGATLTELATRLGLDPAALEATVQTYNSYAETGVDLEFNKGENVYDRSNGDPSHQPNPCIGKIEVGPFYAVEVIPTPLGTALGLAANENAQVLDKKGDPIPGLYVCGNDMSSIMGGEYIGPGGQLGPGMTFAYIAARHAAGLFG